MSEKRMEKVKELLDKYYGTEDSWEQTDLAIEIIQGHVGWLLNRVDELEKDRDALERKISLEYTKRAEHKQALGFYADKNNYEVNVTDQWEPVRPILKDGGEKARNILKGE